MTDRRRGPVAPLTAATRRTWLAMAGGTVAAALAKPALADPPETPVRIDDPPPGKARVVFFRRWNYAGGAISYIVREGTSEVGRLSNGSYFVADMDPGLHTFTVHAERHKDMQLVVEDGEIYYVLYEIALGVILYQPDLTPSEQWQFEAISAKLTRSKPLTPAEPAKPPPSDATPAAAPPAAPAAVGQASAPQPKP